MNELPPYKRRALKHAFVHGASLREAARAACCSKVTAARYLDLWAVDRAPCGCGQPAGHQGWCRARVERSPLRKAFLQRFGRKDSGGLDELFRLAKEQAGAMGHRLGRFLWSGELAGSVAYACCQRCGSMAFVKSDRIEGGCVSKACELATERLERMRKNKAFREEMAS